MIGKTKNLLSLNTKQIHKNRKVLKENAVLIDFKINRLCTLY